MWNFAEDLVFLLFVYRWLTVFLGLLHSGWKKERCPHQGTVAVWAPQLIE